MSAARKLTVNLPCEVCGDTRQIAWRRHRYPEYGYPGNFVLCRCAGCGLAFNSPRLDSAALERLYDANYYIFAEHVTEAFDRVAALHQATVAQLEAMAPTGSMLEVGSAKGYMMALLSDRGRQIRGVELSAHASDFASRILRVPTFHGTLQAWVNDPQFVPAEVAYSTDVIEHVPSPLAFLQAMHRAVAPGGLLLVGTPNVESDGVAMFGDRWLGFNPFHIFLLSRPTLLSLLERTGFEPLRSYSFGNTELGCYPTLSPVKRALRYIAARTGLLSALRGWRAASRQRQDEGALNAARTRAVQQLAQAADWHDTADGRHPRAALCRGDNLVVIARRRDAAPT